MSKVYTAGQFSITNDCSPDDNSEDNWYAEILFPNQDFIGGMGRTPELAIEAMFEKMYRIPEYFKELQ